MERRVGRLESLDYLRGLMALSVLVFHYDKWTTGVWRADTIQGKLGVYAVSAFFIISGMALAHTYAHVLHARAGAWRTYAWKRVLRIFPLLWLVTTATLLLDDTPRPWSTILLNYSGLFGFWDASADIATGAWSIGCELVYYVAFPFLLWMGEFRKALFLIVWVALTLLGLGQAYFYPFDGQPVAQSLWWPHYTQALNHAWFFMTGMAVSVFQPLVRTVPTAYWRALAAAGLLAFIAVSIPTDPWYLAGGSYRLQLSVFTVAVCVGWSLGVPRLQGMLHQALFWLGAVSYALYLWHPLVYRAVLAVNTRYLSLPESLLPYWAFFITLGVSHVSYFWFERRVARG